MVGFSIIAGRVSHIISSTTVSGQVNRGRGTVSTSHKMSFRVNGRPAVFSGTPNVGEGDHVTLSGSDKGGEFRATALRNDSTGVEYLGSTISYYVGGVLLFVVGLPLSFIILGIPFLLFSPVLIFMGFRNQLANNKLRQSPRPDLVGQT